MTSITFTGDPRAQGFDPPHCEMYGVRFPLGKAVEVDDDLIVAKLRRHSHFTVDGPATKAESLAKAREAKAAKKAQA